MKLLFIVNPVAGKGKAKKLIPEIEDAVGGMDGVDFKIVCTEKAGEAVGIASAAAGEKCDIVFAVGGDGTVNEVANGLVNTGCAMAVIPGGSGNDFIRSFGMKGSVRDIIGEAIGCERSYIDVGFINNRCFVNIASVGFDAEVVINKQKVERFFLSGSLAYLAGLIITIMDRKSPYVRITADGRSMERKILLAAIANGKYYGGGMMPTPEAAMDDGLFDICLVSAISKMKMFFLFPKFMKGTHGSIKEVSFFRSESVLIESDEPIPVNVDGDVFEDTRVLFKLIKRGLCVAMPIHKDI